MDSEHVVVAVLEFTPACHDSAFSVWLPRVVEFADV
jgi:hypothetical protein